jgi:hypothetical protein
MNVIYVKSSHCHHTCSALLKQYLLMRQGNTTQQLWAQTIRTSSQGQVGSDFLETDISSSAGYWEERCCGGGARLGFEVIFCGDARSRWP